MNSPSETGAAVATDCCAPPVSAAEEGCCATDEPVRKRDNFLWFVVGSVVFFYILGLVLPHSETMGPLTTMSHSVVELLNRMWWGIALGVIFVGILARIPRDLVMSVLGIILWLTVQVHAASFLGLVTSMAAIFPVVPMAFPPTAWWLSDAAILHLAVSHFAG